jgi:peptidoglycan/LPS O-acetylase OafA/YrhL
MRAWSGSAPGWAGVASTPDAPGSGSPRSNGFGLLRLVLASLVVVQHALALTGHEDDTYVGWWRPLSVGELAVAGFFALSGYLLYASAQRHPPRHYLRLRFFRLFPGFWTTLVVVAFVAAPIAAGASGHWSQYPVIGGGSATSYVVLNSSLVIFQHGIGALLSANPWPGAWDGSLWSLAPEFGCYLALLAACLLARRRHWSPAVPLAALGVASALLLAGAGPVLGDARGVWPALLGSLGLAFFSGALLSWTGWLSAPDAGHAAGIVLVTAVVIATGLWVPLGPPLLAASIIAVGRSLTSGWPTRADTRADLSYGMYLYHFPVIQLLIALGATSLTTRVALLWLTPLTLAVTAVLAAGSWFLVEAPAQRHARRHKRPGEPAVGPVG